MHYSGSEDELVLGLDDFLAGYGFQNAGLALFMCEAYHRDLKAEKRRGKGRLSIESTSSERF